MKWLVIYTGGMSICVLGFWLYHSHLLPTKPSERCTEVARLFNGTGHICTMITFAIQLNVSYPTLSDEYIYGIYNFSTDNAAIHQINGLCDDGNMEQFILISWIEKDSRNLVNFTFRLNESSHDYSLYRIDFELSAKLLPNGTDEMLTFHHTGDIFKTRLGMSYHCSKESILELTSSAISNDTVGTVSFSQMLAEAYRTTADEVFSTAIDCNFYKTPGGIFIALGFAFILFTSIIGAAFLEYHIRRRNNPTRGYNHMS